MNINGYIRKFGNKTFEEKEFNDVDALILAELSYINIDMLLPVNKDKVYIRDIDISSAKRNVFFDSVDAPYNKTMLKRMKDSVRFKDCLIRDIVKKFSKEDVNQFYAMSIVFPNNDVYISFRGTDITLIGWKEDFFISYQESILSQVQALDYSERIISKCKNRFYLGGHSKGGNLAFYVALNFAKKYEDRFINAYSFDGPGFKDGIEHLPNYESCIDRMIKYRTYNDVVGSFFNNMTKYKVVHSTGALLGGHDPFFWQIIASTGEFMYAKDISSTSKKYSKRIMNWLNSLSFEDRELATNAVFEVLRGDNIYDLLKNFGKNILTSKKNLSSYSNDEQEHLKEIFKKLFKYAMLENPEKKKNKPKAITKKQ